MEHTLRHKKVIRNKSSHTTTETIQAADGGRGRLLSHPERLLPAVLLFSSCPPSSFTAADSCGVSRASEGRPRFPRRPETDTKKTGHSEEQQESDWWPGLQRRWETGRPLYYSALPEHAYRGDIRQARAR